MASLDEIMAEEEARRVAETRAEMTAEQAAWQALSPEEREAEIARMEAKREAKFANTPVDDDEDPEEEDDGE
jgi:predicted Fe-S protein YdhL (DUF1289 family)